MKISRISLLLRRVFYTPFVGHIAIKLIPTKTGTLVQSKSTIKLSQDHNWTYTSVGSNVKGIEV